MRWWGWQSAHPASDEPMPRQSPKPVIWTTVLGSVCGAGHTREAVVNQDAIASSTADGGAFAVVAVADGHGDIAHLRSADGARLAVQTAVDLMVAHRSRLCRAEPEELVVVLRAIFSEVVTTWRRLVLDDAVTRPVSTAEFTARGLTTESASEAVAKVTEAEPSTRLYGSTLLVVAVWPSGGAAVRLGDGHVAVVSPAAADPIRAVFADDLGDATQSLCGDDPDAAVECEVLDLAGVAAIVLSTDGYSKSFRHFDDFLKNLGWAIEQLASREITASQQWLEEWLNEVSRDGSEDDVSCGVLRGSAEGREHHPEPRATENTH